MWKVFWNTSLHKITKITYKIRNFWTVFDEIEIIFESIFENSEEFQVNKTSNLCYRIYNRCGTALNPSKSTSLHHQTSRMRTLPKFLSQFSSKVLKIKKSVQSKKFYEPKKYKFGFWRKILNFGKSKNQLFDLIIIILFKSGRLILIIINFRFI